METLNKEKRSFKFTWRIKNFSFCWKMYNNCIDSPIFQLFRNDTFSWKLKLFPFDKNNICCFLVMSKKHSFYYSVGYELAFLSADNSTLNSLEVPKATFKEEVLDSPLIERRDVILNEERTTFLPNDTLTIQCKIWPLGDWTLDKEQCFAETEIQIHSYSSIWRIERFSNLKLHEKVSQISNDAPRNKSPISFSLCQRETIICLEVNPVGVVPFNIYKYQVFLLNSEGLKIRLGACVLQLNFKDIKKPLIHVLNFTPRNLFQNKQRYLPNDTLTLQFEIQFSTGREISKILEPNFLQNSSNVAQIVEPDSLKNSSDDFPINEPNFCSNSSDVSQMKEPNSQPNSSNVTQIIEPGSHLNCSDETQTIAADNVSLYAERCAESSLPWKEDLLLMYEKGLLCDTNLKTFSKSLPVHSLILRIQSSVFNDMLDSEDSGSLYIEKLDANTVQKLIFYLYTGTLDDLNMESAKHLYFASNKYEITSLKHLCSSFLTEHLEPTNCCDILCMAGILKDHSLISSVQCFISKHAKEILLSDPWENLEQEHPLLACKTLRKLYLEN